VDAGETGVSGPDPDAGHLLRVGERNLEHEQSPTVEGFSREDPNHLARTDGLALVASGRHFLPDADELLGHLPRERHPRPLRRGVVALVDEADREAGADRHAAQAADAIPDEPRPPEEVPFGDCDPVRDADVRAGIARDLLGAAEDRVDAHPRGRRIRPEHGTRMRAQHRLDAQPLGRDSRRDPEVVQDRPGDDLAGEHRGGGLRDLVRVARGVDPHPEPAPLLEELVDGRQSDRHEHGVDRERFLRAFDRSEATVHAGDGHPLHPVLAFGPEHGVGGEDRHAEPQDLVPVHLVAAALGQYLGEPHDVHARLQRLVGDDQADVPAADDEEALRGFDEVAVDERLEGARPVDSREVRAGERERLFAGPGGDEHAFRSDEREATLLQDPHDPVLKDAHDRGIGPDVHVLLGPRLFLEGSADGGAPLARVAVLHGAEEVVRLQAQLAAERLLIVAQDAAHALRAELDRRRQSGGAASHDEDVGRDLGDLAPQFHRRVVREEFR